MFNRRKFIKASALSAGLLAIDKTSMADAIPEKPTKAKNFPIVISTWDFGIAANADAWKVLSKGGRALDAVEQGVWVPEADEKNQSVGYR